MALFTVTVLCTSLRYIFSLMCDRTTLERRRRVRWQGCGLGLDVSRRTNVSSRSRLEKNCQRLGLGRETSRSRLGLGHLRSSRAQDQFRPNCAGHSTQCKRALNVVSLCVVAIAHSYNTLKTMNVKDDI